MPLSLRQFRYFVATAEAGQVSQAAASLNVSQSTVTAALQKLEAELGAPLFRRLASGMELTVEGSRFLTHARNVLAAVTVARRAQLRETTELKGSIRVGLTYTVAGYFLPRHYARFTRNYPDIRIELNELPRAAIEEGLKDGTLDIAVMLVSNLEDRERIASETLFRSRRRLWLPVEHPLLQADTIDFADVAQAPYVMLTVDEAQQTASRYWASNGLHPNVIFVTSSVEAVRSMVADGLGVTILSDMVYRPWSLEGQRIEQRNLQTPIPTMDVGLAWRRSEKLARATRAFADFIGLSVNGGV
jgi:DNA-binding transcriptional LysR family regulator